MAQVEAAVGVAEQQHLAVMVVLVGSLAAVAAAVVQLRPGPRPGLAAQVAMA